MGKMHKYDLILACVCVFMGFKMVVCENTCNMAGNLWNSDGFSMGCGKIL